jgi:transposase
VDKTFLEECLAEGLSLDAIGERVGKHESTVSYWLKKHGLLAGRGEKHSSRGGLEKETLEELLAADMSLREIASQVDRSLGTVRYWLRRYDLKARQCICRLERVGRRRRAIKRKLVAAEARKCILLCANCHAEVEAGITAVPLNSVPEVSPE